APRVERRAPGVCVLVPLVDGLDILAGVGARAFVAARDVAAVRRLRAVPKVAVWHVEGEARPPVALAIAQLRQVDGQHDRPVAGRRGPFDEAPRPARVDLGVELE